ncbi:hypothetical protein D3C78_1499560 [compost metagenome]
MLAVFTAVREHNVEWFASIYNGVYFCVPFTPVGYLDVNFYTNLLSCVCIHGINSFAEVIRYLAADGPPEQSRNILTGCWGVL